MIKVPVFPWNQKQFLECEQDVALCASIKEHLERYFHL